MWVIWNWKSCGIINKLNIANVKLQIINYKLEIIWSRNSALWSSGGNMRNARQMYDIFFPSPVSLGLGLEGKWRPLTYSWHDLVLLHDWRQCLPVSSVLHPHRVVNFLQNVTTQRAENPQIIGRGLLAAVPARLLRSVVVGGLVRCAAVDGIINWRWIASNRHDSIVIAGAAERCRLQRSILNPMIAPQRPIGDAFGV